MTRQRGMSPRQTLGRLAWRLISAVCLQAAAMALLLDTFSRYVVGWLLEMAALSKVVIAMPTRLQPARVPTLPAMLILVLAAWPAAAQEEPSDAAKPVQLPPVVVIGSTPVPALGTPIEKYAGNVQSISAETMDNQNLLNLSDTLYRNFGSVNINGTRATPGKTT